MNEQIGNKINDKTYIPLTPFKGFVLENFPFIEADFDAITNYQLLCKVIEYLNNVISNQNTVQDLGTDLVNAYNSLVDAVNLAINEFETDVTADINQFKVDINDDFDEFTTNITTQFNNLQNYVNNYFDNNFPELVSDKLDEMAQDGTLENLLNDAAHLIKVYNTHTDMISDSSTFTNGLKIKTLGYNNINDDGGAEYIIRDNEPATYHDTLSNGKYAELITTKKIVPEMFGATGNGVNDDTDAIQNMIDYSISKNIICYLNPKSYTISESINITSDYVVITGIEKNEYKPLIQFNENKTDDYPLFNVISSGCSFSNICFKSSDTYSIKATGIFFNLDNSEKDGNIDANIQNCMFMYLANGIITKGRNINVNNCIFNVSRNGIDLRSTSITTLLYGYDILNNRFHACTICVKNSISPATNSQSIFISGNHIDATNTLFNGNGDGLCITNNYYISPQSFASACIYIASVTNGDSMITIKNNMFNGQNRDDNTIRIRNILNVDSNVNHAYFHIEGNTITNIDGIAIYNNGQQSVSLISNNYINLVNSSSTAVAIKVESKTNRGSAYNNLIATTNTLADVLILPATNFESVNNSVRSLS